MLTCCTAENSEHQTGKGLVADNGRDNDGWVA